MELATVVDLFNQSLAEIGHHGVSTASEDNPEGRVCRRHYPTEFAALLELLPWPFALAERLLEPAWDELRHDTMRTVSTSATVRGMTWDARLGRLRVITMGDFLSQVDAQTGVESDIRLVQGVDVGHGEFVDVTTDPFGRVYLLAVDTPLTTATIYRVKPGTLGAATAMRVARVGIAQAERFAWVANDLFVVSSGADQSLWHVATADRNIEAIERGRHALTGLADLTWSGESLYGADDAALYAIDWGTGEAEPVASWPTEVGDVDHLAWDGDEFRALHGLQLHTVMPDRSVDRQDLWRLPADFLRKWTWDDNQQRRSERARQPMLMRNEDLVQEGRRYMRSMVSFDYPTLRYVRHVPLQETTALFRQLLMLKLARRVGPRFNADNFLMREIHVEETRKQREAQKQILAQREETEREPTWTDLRRGYGRYGGGRGPRGRFSDSGLAER